MRKSGRARRCEEVYFIFCFAGWTFLHGGFRRVERGVDAWPAKCDPCVSRHLPMIGWLGGWALGGKLDVNCDYDVGGGDESALDSRAARGWEAGQVAVGR